MLIILPTGWDLLGKWVFVLLKIVTYWMHSHSYSFFFFFALSQVKGRKFRLCVLGRSFDCRWTPHPELWRLHRTLRGRDKSCLKKPQWVEVCHCLSLYLRYKQVKVQPKSRLLFLHIRAVLYSYLLLYSAGLSYMVNNPPQFFSILQRFCNF